jgi:hypothetical protein
MVQFKTTDIAYRKRYSYSDSTYAWWDSYWKLGFDRHKTIKYLFEYLRDRGYECRQNVSRPGVVDALGRYQRGLISYEGRSVNELQAFCEARGLPAKGTSASRLARALEKADILPHSQGSSIYPLRSEMLCTSCTSMASILSGPSTSSRLLHWHQDSFAPRRCPCSTTA